MRIKPYCQFYGLDPPLGHIVKKKEKRYLQEFSTRLWMKKYCCCCCCCCCKSLCRYKPFCSLIFILFYHLKKMRWAWVFRTSLFIGYYNYRNGFNNNKNASFFFVSDRNSLSYHWISSKNSSWTQKICIEKLMY